jgi:hypothetical protein
VLCAEFCDELELDDCELDDDWPVLDYWPLIDDCPLLDPDDAFVSEADPVTEDVEEAPDDDDDPDEAEDDMDDEADPDEEDPDDWLLEPDDPDDVWTTSPWLGLLRLTRTSPEPEDELESLAVRMLVAVRIWDGILVATVLALLITFEAIPAVDAPVVLMKLPSFRGCPRRLEGLSEAKMMACSVCETSIMPARRVTNFIKFLLF